MYGAYNLKYHNVTVVAGASSRSLQLSGAIDNRTRGGREDF